MSEVRNLLNEASNIFESQELSLKSLALLLGNKIGLSGNIEFDHGSRTLMIGFEDGRFEWGITGKDGYMKSEGIIDPNTSTEDIVKQMKKLVKTFYEGIDDPKNIDEVSIEEDDNDRSNYRASQIQKVIDSAMREPHYKPKIMIGHMDAKTNSLDISVQELRSIMSVLT